MDINELLSAAQTLTSELFSRKLNEFIRANFRFSNLNEKNRRIFLDLVAKYKQDYLRHGRKVPGERLRLDSLKLYTDRVKLGITEEDLKDLRELLAIFK
ncbi:hypothetical protein COX69_02520 [Candidatus Falkowbacteria bacterium CG_4_10_14_0_2_um_filter_48_10]|uniref:Uncharacterized protein n=1 Tax=Candidatus Falkowbacteria bacterium CG23_combo_of_CG06-09_8_20_14_all_49_15 TaxID=1974572 RepID=A0A2G9ZJM1_9BACT|nr:MAG: hypothetical protein COX22_04775 [Candidatus Falkowbacteria bacterium CG23_combo_of_CG06-09_8_20_14_all_49_15]PJA08363.1 MAG: hypothetical protein COX69_02520 [Candidatus Falkowbacteria bacterium CG_4_10_14_0_2_um_filter_48_10]